MSESEQQLQSYIRRVQRLVEERKSIADDIAEVLAEAKSAGFDKAAIKWVVSELAKPEADRQERDHIRDLYWQAASDLVHVPAHTREAA